MNPVKESTPRTTEEEVPRSQWRRSFVWEEEIPPPLVRTLGDTMKRKEEEDTNVSDRKVKK